MYREETLGLFKTILNRFNKSKERNSDLSLDMRGADLEGQDLVKADLRRVDFEGACFRRANLEGASFTNSRLVGADFREANLEGASFHRAELQNADLRGAKFGAGDEPSLRICIHANCFRGVRLDQEHLEEFLRVLNMNQDWEIRYQIVPKG